MVISLFLFFQLSFLTGCGKEDAPRNDPAFNTNTTFTNPIMTNGPDPWVAQKDGIYYYTHTMGNRIGIYKTNAVTQLRATSSKTIWTPPATGAYSRNIWAPEFHFVASKWYCYFAADDGNDENHRMYVIENSSPDPTTGTWEFKGKISDPSDKWAIDGTVLEHEGQLYFLWSGWEGTDPGSNSGRQQIYIATMSNPWTISSERVMISRPTYNWEMNGLVNEGPVILKNKEGDVFLIYSGSGCWTDDYSLGMLRLKEGGNPMSADDWEKKATPVLSKNPANGAYGPGHNGFFTSPDGTEDWIIYHANTLSGQGCGGTRNTRIQKFSWNADGTPNFGEPANINIRHDKPSGEVQ
ncbi:glycosyl hydrolase family 43 [Pontibacter sp. SGAir0037]|nr:glycosyl hydrolase family 43 [Pontibacter sp. SGAir0037]